MYSYQELERAILLYRSKNIGNIGFRYLVDIFIGSKNPFSQALEKLKNINFFWNKRSIVLEEEKNIKIEIEKTFEFGANFLIYGNNDFPNFIGSKDLSLIKNFISAIPPVLIYKGNKNLLEKNILTVVGTRNPSCNGTTFCEEFIERAKEKFIIASGLALGIDTVAHKKSLENGTIAAIAGGINDFYPFENKFLQEKIYKNGLVLSMQPIGFPANKTFFPRRNALLAALGSSTVVIESTESSGALITANEARKMKKVVWAVPGHPYDIRYKGNNNLIKTGAKILTSFDDFKEEVFFKEPDFSNSANTTFSNVSDNERNLIYNLLSSGPTSLESLISISCLSINAVLSIIVEMEISGLVTLKENNVYKIKNRE